MMKKPISGEYEQAVLLWENWLCNPNDSESRFKSTLVYINYLDKPPTNQFQFIGLRKNGPGGN